MSTEDFIIELFCRVDDELLDVKKHSQASRIFSIIRGEGTREREGRSNESHVFVI